MIKIEFARSPRQHSVPALPRAREHYFPQTKRNACERNRAMDVVHSSILLSLVSNRGAVFLFLCLQREDCHSYYFLY